MQHKPRPWDIKRTTNPLTTYTWAFWGLAGPQTLVLDPANTRRIIESVHLFLNPIPHTNTSAIETVRSSKFEIGLTSTDIVVSIHLTNLQSTMQTGAQCNILYDGTPPTYLNSRIDLWLDFPIILGPNDMLWVSLPGVHGSTDITFHLHLMGYSES